MNALARLALPRVGPGAARRRRLACACAAGLPAFLVCALACLALAPASAQYSVSQYPMLVSSPPTPNLVITIDDSGSTAWAYAPDSVGSYDNTLGFASSDFNHLYYNPNVTYAPPLDANGVLVPTAFGSGYPLTSFTSAYLDGYHPDKGTINLATGYSPTKSLAYPPSAGGALSLTAAAGIDVDAVQLATGNYATGVGPAFYNVYVPGGACPALPLVPGTPPPGYTNTGTPVTGVTCFQTVPIPLDTSPASQAIQQNFAIWYSFYRTRHLSIISAAAQSMQDPSLAGVRIAWQALNTCNDFSSGTSCQGWAQQIVDNRISQFANQHKSDFYSWLYEIPAANYTPTRQAWWRAGQYFSTAGANSPYGMNPNPGLSGTSSSAGPELLCVNNFNVTITDGLWNRASESVSTFCGSSNCGHQVDTNQNFPDGTTYSTSSALTQIYGDNGTSSSSGGDNGADADGLGALADIAFYYWRTNLRPDLTGFYIPPYVPDMTLTNPINGSDATWPYWNPHTDPATWPHLVNFTVGVGLTGFLSIPSLTWGGDAFSGTSYNNLLTAQSVCLPPSVAVTTPTTMPPATSVCTWPQVYPPATGGGFLSGYLQSGNVYDLWHAAAASRGNAFSSETPQDIVQAMGTIIARVEGQTIGNSSAAGSSSSLSASTELFIASYDGTDWHGTVTAYGIGTNGSVNSTYDWQTTASSLPPPATRANTVFTSAAALPAGGSGLSGSLGMNFTPGSTPSAIGSTSSSCAPSTTNNNPAVTSSVLGLYGSYFGDTSNNQNLAICYLLGDTSGEVQHGGYFRNRHVVTSTGTAEVVLGDIVDSNPVYSWKEDFGYATTLSAAQGGGSYQTYLAAKAARTPMVYAGANDGMLHAFNATFPATTGNTPGAEMFAYVPHSVIPNLGRVIGTTAGTAPTLTGLLNPTYIHSFNVDGPVFVGDAYFTPAGTPAAASWHSVLLGTTGAGGRGIFALDVTAPQSFTASNVLWDFDGSTFGSNDLDLGDTIGTPIIALTNSGDWAAVFGNGYLSRRGCAVLFVVRIADGKLLSRIDTSGAGSGATAACSGSNGNNGLGSPTLLDIDQNGSTDFVFAGDLQGNLWKFDLTSSDPTQWKVAYQNAATQPLPLYTARNAYGAVQPIVAAPNLGPSAGSASAFLVYFVTGRMFAVGDQADTTTQSLYAIQDQGAAITRTDRATLVQQVVVGATGGNENIQTPYPSDNPTGDGWYVDFPNSGERALTTPILVAGLALFSTVIPQAQPCNGGCGGFVYALSQFDGRGGQDYLFSGGVSYDAIATTVGCVKGLTLISSGSTLNWYASGNGLSPTPGSTTPSPGTGPGNSGAPLIPGNGPSSASIQHGSAPVTAQGRISWHEYVPQP